MDQTDSTRNGPRAWEIILKGGARIEFTAEYNYPNSNGFGPSDLLRHYQDFRNSGQKPANPARTAYRFPKKDGQPQVAYALNVDIEEIVAIGMRFP
ncbi:hypothetical protein [Stappia indica]|uniref:hypothetical protein n=1 Tax=Stappia indica TaxID=538381 RepID=UPI001CD48001|nr:hypothetical protein [Stappia indica]MCA1300061.1 hypothetical protein [Stappia indica]